MDPGRGIGGVSYLKRICPKVETVFSSGDTGNGFRSIPAAYYYSTFFEKYGIKVVLIPLAPRHAFNDVVRH